MKTIEEVHAELKKSKINMNLTQAPLWFCIGASGGGNVILDGETVAVVVKAKRRSPSKGLTRMTEVLKCINNVSPIRGFVSLPSIFALKGRKDVLVLAYPVFPRPVADGIREVLKKFAERAKV